jgi:acyl-homoserine-lactone acylase
MGRPHVFAADEQGAFFAFGWAQMRAHGDLILRLWAGPRPRAGYWGEVETDRG